MQGGPESKSFFVLFLCVYYAFVLSHFIVFMDIVAL